MLEEMEWLSKDFREERQWKIALARKAVKAVSKWHQDRARSERERALDTRQVAVRGALEQEASGLRRAGRRTVRH